MKNAHPVKAAQKIIAVTLLSFMLATTSAVAVDLPVDEAALIPQSQNGISYLSGGIGDEELTFIKQATREYNLHLTFSEGRSNAYVSDIKLTINNLRGKTLLALEQAGPLVYVKLPAGRYDISAELEGRIEKRRVVVGAKMPKTVQFHWPSSSKEVATR